MKVALIGATGKTGGWVLAGCLARGWEVRALVRNREKLSDYACKITIVTGNDCNQEDLGSLLDLEGEGGVDVVISTIGSPNKTTLVVQKAAEALVSALEGAAADKQQQQIPRIVWMTSTGINEATDQAKMYYPLFGKTPSKYNMFGYSLFGWFQYKLLIPFVIGQGFWDDMGYSEDLIRAASGSISKKWVLVRPANMWPISEHPTFSEAWRNEGGDTLKYILAKADDPPVGKWICRRAIAAALLDLVEDPSHDGTAVSLFQG